MADPAYTLAGAGTLIPRLTLAASLSSGEQSAVAGGVPISTDEGNAAQVGSDGGVYVPPPQLETAQW